MDLQSLGSFHGRFKNNNGISFNGKYCRHSAYELYLGDKKSLQHLALLMNVRVLHYTIHMIGVHYYSKVYLMTIYECSFNYWNCDMCIA